MSKDLALSIKNLKKVYNNGFEALKGINLEVEKGDFFALLGPNGAGKSTTIGIITSLVNKTSGKVKVMGTDIDKDFDLAKSYIGVVPQEFNLSIFETVENIVITQAGYQGIPLNEARKGSEYYLKKLGLWEKRKNKVMMLSGGMKRRLMIARALIHEPKILILDEPTAGVDIEIRRSMWEFIKEINKEKNITIILTTHYLEEAEELCKNVAIIDNGNIVVSCGVKELLKRSNIQNIIVDSKDNIKKLPNIKDLEMELIDENSIEIKLKKDISITYAIDQLHKNNIEVLSMRNKRNRLEELFVELTDKGDKNE